MTKPMRAFRDYAKVHKKSLWGISPCSTKFSKLVQTTTRTHACTHKHTHTHT